MNREEGEYMNQIIKEKSRLRQTVKKYKNLLDNISEKVDDLYWEYDRMSSSGTETLDKLAKSLGMKEENK
jgi:uncharacterized coiled-coil DUF342 family protein